MKRINGWMTGSAVVVTLACAARADVSASWSQDADGNWSDTGQWAGGNAATGTTGVATFTRAITATRTVTVDASPWTINGLTFGNTGASGWTITGGTLTLAGTTPTVTVSSSGTAKIVSALSGSDGLTKAGTGTLTLSGANTYSGDTIRSDGGLQIGDGTSATATAGTGILAAGNGSTLFLNLNGPATLPNSSVTSSGSMIQNIGSGKVTLTNGAMACTIDGGSAGIVLAKLLTAQFTVRGDVTFGSDTGSYVASPGTAGATMRIVNKGNFWWIGSSSAANAPNIDIAAGVTVSLSGSQGAGAIYYKNLSGAGNFTFDGGNANQLGTILGTSTLGGTLTANRTIFFGNGGATGAAGATKIASTANGPVTFNTTIDTTYAGSMGGAGALIKTNANTLTLSGTNTYSGATMINQGTLAIGAAGTLGGGVYVGNIVNNGTFVYGSSVEQTLSGGISGTGSLTKTNSGTLTLSGYNTYSGATRVNAGKLVGVTGGACLNSPVTIADGATNAVKIAVFGGQWACAGLTCESGTVCLDFDLALLPVSTTAAPLQINGDLNVTGIVDVVVRNGFWPATGTYPLVSYTGTLNGPGTFSLANLPQNMEATLVTNSVAKRLELSVTSIPTASGAVSTWTHLVSGTASGEWGTPANWDSDIPDAMDAVADFSTLDILAASYINNDAPRTVGTLRFADTAASHDWTVTNALLTLASSVGMPTITVLNRHVNLLAGLAGTQGFLKNGTGTLRLSGLENNTLSGQVVVSAGDLYVYKGASLKNTSGTITVLSDACLDIYADWDGNALANTVYLSGNGIGARGALHIQTNLRVDGPINLVTDSKITFENHCFNYGPITATGAGKNLVLGQPGLFEKNYGFVINGNISLGSGALTISSVPGGGSALGYCVELNAANTYSGGTVLTNYAILRLGHVGALGSGGVTLYPTASLDLNARSVTIAWLSGPGGVITDAGESAGNTTLTVNQSSDTTFYGAISNVAHRALALVKTGDGSLALSGTNTYTGTTTVQNGTLCANGSLGSSSVTINTGCAFAAGTTSTVGRVSLAGTLTFQNNSRLLVNVQPPSADAIAVSGNVTIGSGVELRVSGDQMRGGSWKVVESTAGTISGDFILVGGVGRTRLVKDGSVVWLTIPPKGTLVQLL